VSSGHHGDFVRKRTGTARGNGQIVTTEGKQVGSHDGIENFTIGQRKGLGVAMLEPYFVVGIDADNNKVTIGKRSELARTQLWADRCNWLTDKAVDPDRLNVQIRYNSTGRPAEVDRHDDGTMNVRFHDSVEAIAPGQLAVAYEGDRVLGGGWILDAK
jgi:tRNA-specific 2-thiouridylase